MYYLSVCVCVGASVRKICMHIFLCVCVGARVSVMLALKMSGRGERGVYEGCGGVSVYSKFNFFWEVANVSFNKPKIH